MFEKFKCFIFGKFDFQMLFFPYSLVRSLWTLLSILRITLTTAKRNIIVL
jgi:hypothetical protein